MEFRTEELDKLAAVNGSDETRHLVELSDLQLAAIAGGAGDVVFA